MSHLKIKIFVLAALLGLPFISLAKDTTPMPLTPGPNDGNIAYITARLLGLYHYSQTPFDRGISEKFFDAYIDAFDPQHLYFLQSDIDEFSQYRTNLDILTLSNHDNHEEANVQPAFKIFQRFMERLQQRAVYSEDMLKHENFTFDSDENLLIDRKNAPYAKNLDEAKELWRQQVMFQFLQEKLNRENSPDSKLAATNLTDIAQTIEHHYESELRTAREWDSTDVMQAYLDSLARAYDPHSDYLNNEHAQDFSINMSLALYGIGAELMSDDGYCKIESLVPGGPAEKSKLIKPNDKIIAVAQTNQPPVDVVDMELGKIVQLIRGQKGTEVRLTVVPADDPTARKVIKLVRAEITLKDQESKASLIEMPDSHGTTNRLGVITVPSFYAPVSLSGNNAQANNYVSADVAQLIQKLKKENVQGIILDLRNNPGGSLAEAIQFVGLFVTNGPVVQIRSPEGHIDIQGNDDAPNLYHGPLIVLVNRFSASASEIVAAALQDYGRALIVGDTSTFGKGTVQNLTPLAPLVWPASDTATNDPGTVKITIRKFYRINGSSTQLKGVVPDIVLPDVLSYRNDVGENALPNAMQWDPVTSADYTKLGYVQPYLPELRKKAAEEVATNQDFTYVRQEISEFQQLQSQKFETLNERKAWDEKEKPELLGKAYNKEVDSRKVPNETVYDITLADTSKPGLPLPVHLEAGNESTNTVTIVQDKNLNAFFKGSTNVVARAPQTATATNSDAVTRVWQPDPMLDESERILQDYIALQPSNWDAAANHE